MEKRGQVTIFIILGVLIVLGSLIFFFISSGTLKELTGNVKEISPERKIVTCTEDSVRESVNILLNQGGYLKNPLNKSFQFSGENETSDLSFLCYNRNYYLPCINQQPMLIQHLKKEIQKYNEEKVENCFNSLVLDMEKEGYDVESNYRGFNVDFKEGSVILNINARLKYDKTNRTVIKNNFTISHRTNLYDLAIVAQEIVSQEARFCHFETQGFSIFYPKFKIRRVRTGDLLTVYKIKHMDSGEVFKFAVRGCVLPPGI